jgi:S1-C subfamily serine protease
MGGLNMKYRLVVYGLLAICATWVFTTKAQSPQREEAEILIVANPINPLNPVVRNPYQDEYERMLYPTVRITAGFSTGSGVIIDLSDKSDRYSSGAIHRTYILTAAHVVENETTVSVELYNLEVITGTVVITDTTKDLALIRIINPPQSPFDKGGSKGGFYSARLAPESYQAYLFTPVYTVGCSLGLLPRPSQGIISAITTDSWEVSSPILPGNSGGPVYDARTYEVIGIAVWVKVYNGQLVTTMAGIVPINQIYEFLDTHSLRSVQADKHR